MRIFLKLLLLLKQGCHCLLLLGRLTGCDTHVAFSSVYAAEAFTTITPVGIHPSDRLATLCIVEVLCNLSRDRVIVVRRIVLCPFLIGVNVHIWKDTWVESCAHRLEPALNRLDFLVRVKVFDSETLLLLL